MSAQGRVSPHPLYGKVIRFQQTVALLGTVPVYVLVTLTTAAQTRAVMTLTEMRARFDRWMRVPAWCTRQVSARKFQELFVIACDANRDGCLGPLIFFFKG